MRILILFFAIHSSLASDLPEPFWRKKPEVQERMRKEDLIVVSAHVDKIQEGALLYQMKVTAGGDVKVPLDFAFKEMTNYEKLSDADSHFHDVKYNKAKNIVSMRVEALGYHADMTLKVNEMGGKKVDWECIKGTFLGMKGMFQVVEIERQRTEISMTADYKSEKLPLPKVLMGFGLEIIGRQVAVQMKKYIQDQYRGQHGT